MGIPFEFMGRDPAQGLDCTGLILELFRRLGEEIHDPKDHHEACEGEFVEVEGTRRLADVIHVDTQATGLADHLAFYLGMGMVIHAHQARGVEVVPVQHLEGDILATYRLARYVENC